MKRDISHLCILVGVIGLAVAVVWLPSESFGQAAGGAAGANGDIATLMKAAANADESIRESALDKLAEIGAPAVEAIRKVATEADKHLAPERAEAAAVLGRLTKMSGPDIVKFRKAGEDAFAEGRYDVMARKYARLAVLEDTGIADRIWNGHARQLAGNWPAAVAAYKGALDRIDDFIRKPVRVMIGPGGDMEDIVRTETLEEDRARVEALTTQRTELLLLIGRIQHHECGQPGEAAFTYAMATGGYPDMERPLADMLKSHRARLADVVARKPLDHPNFGTGAFYAAQCLSETAECLEQTGMNAAAVERYNTAYAVGLLRGRSGGLPAILSMVRAFRKITPGSTLPAAPWLIVLSEKSPTAVLSMDNIETLARAFQYDNPDTPSWHFAFVAPPGQEFATIEFACDIEQIALHTGGQFTCSAALDDDTPRYVPLGGIGWDKDKPGREVVTRKFAVPPGASALLVTTGTWKDSFVMRDVKAAATFRPRGKPDAAAQPETRISQEMLPAGGTFTFNGKPSEMNTYRNTTPGKYTFAYEVPGRDRKFVLTLECLSGRHYHVFANLDSPFERTLTTLQGMNKSPVCMPGTGLARLPDGRWLAVFCGEGERIMFSASKDLVAWEKPWPLATNSFFRNISPAVLVDGEGTIWLACFLNRLSMEPESSGGYRLWLTHSKDGRTWAAPRPVAVPETGGWPMGNVQMLRDEKGVCWMFWRKYAAAANSPGDIRAMQPIEIALPPDMACWNPHVSVDAKGRMHMVYDNFSRGIWYTRCDDGKKWSDPVEIVPGGKGSPTEQPLIVASGDKLIVIYHCGGTQLRVAGRDAPAKLSPPLKIDWTLSGARPCVTPEGEMVLIGGDSTAWLLRAKLDDIAKIAP